MGGSIVHTHGGPDSGCGIFLIVSYLSFLSCSYCVLCICMRKYIVPLYMYTYIVITFIWGSESFLMSSVS